jgi:hypothetical protein
MWLPEVFVLLELSYINVPVSSFAVVCVVRVLMSTDCRLTEVAVIMSVGGAVRLLVVYCSVAMFLLFIVRVIWVSLCFFFFFFFFFFL